MARQFSQRHYIAVADVLVRAYNHPANNGVYQEVTKVEERSAKHGINTVLAEFEGLFNADSEKFDGGKFHKYIESRKERK